MAATALLSRIVNRLEEGFIAFLLAGMTVLTFVQVVMRYLFATGLLWAIEAVTYMFGWMVLVGISYGVKVGSHIGVDAIVRLLPAQGHRVAGTVAGLLSIGYAALLLFGGWTYVEQVRMIGVEAEDLPVQRWILALAVPFGFGLLLLRLVQVTWRIASGRQTSISNLGAATQEVRHLLDDAERRQGSPRP